MGFRKIEELLDMKHNFLGNVKIDSNFHRIHMKPSTVVKQVALYAFYSQVHVFYLFPKIGIDKSTHDFLLFHVMVIRQRLYVINAFVVHVREIIIVDETYFCRIGQHGTIDEILVSLRLFCPFHLNLFIVNFESVYDLVEQFGFTVEFVYEIIQNKVYPRMIIFVIRKNVNLVAFPG